MDDADRDALLVDDWQDRDRARLVLLHDGERSRRHLLRRNRQRLREHDLLHGLVEELVVLRERAADDAIGDEPDELALVVDDGDSAEALVRHDEQRILDRLAAVDQRVVLARVHDILDLQQQAAAKRAARMEHRKVLAREVALRHQGHGDGIAHGERRRRAGRRGEP